MLIIVITVIVVTVIIVIAVISLIIDVIIVVIIIVIISVIIQSPIKCNFTLNHSLIADLTFRDELIRFLRVSTLFTIGEYVTSLMFYPFSHKTLQTVVG